MPQILSIYTFLSDAYLNATTNWNMSENEFHSISNKMFTF